jgi:hypothetical protein
MGSFSSGTAPMFPPTAICVKSRGIRQVAERLAGPSEVVEDAQVLDALLGDGRGSGTGPGKMEEILAGPRHLVGPPTQASGLETGQSAKDQDPPVPDQESPAGKMALALPGPQAQPWGNPREHP